MSDRIKILRPNPLPPSDLPQCDAVVEDAYRNPAWRQEHYGGKANDVSKCQRHATVQIGDKHYCRPHAGQRALKILLEMQDAKEKQDTPQVAEAETTAKGPSKES